ncbi:unnamed protein product [Gordionus sp. m RMFG-2023]
MNSFFVQKRRLGVTDAMISPHGLKIPYNLSVTTFQNVRELLRISSDFVCEVLNKRLFCHGLESYQTHFDFYAESSIPSNMKKLNMKYDSKNLSSANRLKVRTKRNLPDKVYISLITIPGNAYINIDIMDFVHFDNCQRHSEAHSKINCLLSNYSSLLFSQILRTTLNVYNGIINNNHYLYLNVNREDYKENRSGFKLGLRIYTDCENVEMLLRDDLIYLRNKSFNLSFLQKFVHNRDFGLDYNRFNMLTIYNRIHPHNNRAHKFSGIANATFNFLQHYNVTKFTVIYDSMSYFFMELMVDILEYVSTHDMCLENKISIKQKFRKPERQEVFNLLTKIVQNKKKKVILLLLNQKDFVEFFKIVRDSKALLNVAMILIDNWRYCNGIFKYLGFENETLQNIYMVKALPTKLMANSDNKESLRPFFNNNELTKFYRSSNLNEYKSNLIQIIKMIQFWAHQLCYKSQFAHNECLERYSTVLNMDNFTAFIYDLVNVNKTKGIIDESIYNVQIFEILKRNPDSKFIKFMTTSNYNISHNSVLSMIGKRFYEKLSKNLNNTLKFMLKLRGEKCDNTCPKRFILSSTDTACCSVCYSCPLNYRMHISDDVPYSKSCAPCPEYYWPDLDNGELCQEIPVNYVDNKYYFVILKTLAGFGIILELIILSILLKYKDTLVLKSGIIQINYMLIFGLLLGFVSVFFLLSQPTNWKCNSNNFIVNLAINFIYSTVLIKLIRIKQVHKSFVNNQRIPKIYTLRYVIGALFIMASIQVFLNLAQIILYPHTAKKSSIFDHKVMKSSTYNEFYFKKSQANNSLYLGRKIDNMAEKEYKNYWDIGKPIVKMFCKTTLAGGYIGWIGNGYQIVLLLMCAYYSFSLRLCPKEFVEIRLVSYAVWGCFLLWLIRFIILVTITEASMTGMMFQISGTLLHCYIFTFCIFFPKMHAIVLCANKRPHVMPSVITQ